MLSAVGRPEDTVRGRQSQRDEASENEESLVTLESSFSSTTSNTSGPSSHEDELLTTKRINTDLKANTTTTKTAVATRQLTQEETIDLTRRAVENGIHETKRSLAGDDTVSEVVRPKLTIDLGHSHIVRIPEQVVDIIKDEVERLSLSNNHLFHIPYRFAECAHLRYLNIRANNFREIPKAVFKLPLLEILDISRNKVSKISDEVRKLTALRVFSIMQNRLDDLPLGLADMNKLQILKVAGNSLKYPLRRVLETKEAEVASLSMTVTDKEVAVTAELKRFLKSRQPPPMPTSSGDLDSSSDASENIVDTPKPVKRGLNSRFPVIPSTGDMTTDSRASSFARLPHLPTRSHYRMVSNQSTTFQPAGYSSRPGISPITALNERNRSNSEGIIPLSTRGKRMGALSRKTELGTLDETRPYRNSHFRGLSHGSLFRSTQPGGLDGSNSSSPGSPEPEHRRARDSYTRRMSSLSEHRDDNYQDPIIDGAKGILYSLFQIHPLISTLINVLKEDESRRNSLELVFYNASTHVHQLNEALENAGNVPNGGGDFNMTMHEAVKRECETCIMAYIHVGTQLRHNLEKIIKYGDSRYVRSLMLNVYGSLIELRNACIGFGIAVRVRKESVSSRSKLTQSDSASVGSGPERPPTTATAAAPMKERAQTVRRFRSDTTIQHAQTNLPTAFIPTTQVLSSTASPGLTTPNSVIFASGQRSRSSSRSNTLLNSAALATPRSGEAFPAPLPASVINRINPLTGLDEAEEERIFEKIFHQLTSAYGAALQALPVARRQLSRCLELAEEARESEEVCMLWNNLLRRCRVCLETSEALGLRLSSMKVKEPGGGIRNQREFWQLCKTFMQCFVDLVTDMRDVRNLHLLPSDIIVVLRPVQKASREASKLIEASPWSYLADMSATNPPPIYGPPLQTQNQHNPSGSFIPSAGSLGGLSNTSPQSVPLPATPLSAALGPAAQATVPSTPASAYSDRFFAGDVFQRADSLLSMPSQAPYLYRR